ncbi:MAG: lamin tail domain-containing protein [bacterium]|nr:lamin tail domain-containing protein [bacterium]
MHKWLWIMVVGLFLPAFSVSAVDSDLVISEVLPSPVGDDGLYEFIEIHNLGSLDVDLTGLYLDDAEGSGPSTAYPFVSGTKILAGEYLAFYSEKTRLSLTNGGEVARILKADKTLLTELAYVNAPEGSSFALKSDGSFAWTTILTPGAENQ